MMTFLKFIIFFSITFAVLSFFITLDGDIFSPVGEGQVVLDSGTYEAFQLPEFASSMVDSNYKSYFIEVEPGLIESSN